MKKLQVIVLFMLVFLFFGIQLLSAHENYQNGDTTYVAIMMGGGVSLGTYEAGVLAEIMKQFELYNISHDDKYVIDILVGASAGSMTLGIVADQMYRNNFDLMNVYESPLYKAWVDMIDIRELLPRIRKDIEDDPYIFSSKIIEDIAGKLIPDQKFNYQQVSFAPDTLLMGMTISNMQGLQYQLYFQDDLFKPIYFNSDSRFFKVTASGKILLTNPDCISNYQNDQINWSTVRKTSIASGAFPFAFRPVSLIRYKDEFNQYETPINLPSNNRYTYVDGGFFNNNPISITVKLAENRAEKKRIHSKQRFFLYISPEERLYPEFYNPDVVNDLKKYLGHIIKMEMNTASSLDNKYYIDFILKRKQLLQQDMDRCATLLEAVHAANEIIDKYPDVENELERLNKEIMDKIKPLFKSEENLFVQRAQFAQQMTPYDIYLPDVTNIDSLIIEFVNVLSSNAEDILSKNDSLSIVDIFYPVTKDIEDLREIEIDTLFNEIKKKYSSSDYESGFRDNFIIRHLDHLMEDESDPGKSINKEKIKIKFLKLITYLGHKEPPNLILVSNSMEDGLILRSAGFYHFGGFLNFDVRKHDFEIGRFSA
ncbi:patatin-like phospholipase family protein, partial [candidate division KSB1 bacterium]